jgi:N-acetylmuramoyl-L-alanine amidase
MAKYIALDDGHGMETAGKRTPYLPELGRQYRENEFNREVVKHLNAELKRHGFKTLLTAPTDADTSLSARVKAANNAGVDLFISVHFNALDGTFGGSDPEGFSAHVYKGNRNTVSGKFATVALKHLAQGTKQKNRGLVEQDLYVTRETKMPAVLFELGFMDNKREALLMTTGAFQKECAIELAKAVCEFYGVAYKSEVAPAPKPSNPTPTNLYRVRKSWADAASQIGAFADKDNAIDLAKSKSGYEVYDKDGKQVWPVSAPAKPASQMYRVRKTWADAKSQVGAFKDLENAKELADKHSGYEVYDEKGNVVYAPKAAAPKPAPKPAPAKPKYVIPTQTLKYGMKGTAVKQLQIALNAAYFKCGTPDGSFGPATLDALKRFQSVYANPVDGMFGPKTRAALDRIVNK